MAENQHRLALRAGRFLWAMLVVQPPRLIGKLTKRRVLHLIGLILLLMFFQQVVAMDLTFLFGIDLGLLMEVGAAIFILTARDQVRTVLDQTRRNLKRTVQVVRRGRVRETVTRACRKLLLPGSDEEDGRVFT